VNDFLQFIYYHNPRCGDQQKPDSAGSYPEDTLNKLFWLGAGPASAGQAEYFLPRFQNRTAYDLNARWNGARWGYYQCNLTSTPEALFDKAWTDTRLCIGGRTHGLSLIDDKLCPEELRYNERAVISPTAVTAAENQEVFFLFVFDMRSRSHFEAILNTLQTLFICLLLGVGSVTFSMDTNTYVLTPIERMIAKIEKIRKNPLAALSIGDEEHRKEEIKSTARASRHFPLLAVAAKSTGSDNSMSSRARAKIDKLRQKLCPTRKSPPKESPEPMETVVLEKTIIKIGALLALGFGESGAEIIGQSLRRGDNSALNSMIPGRRVEGIFACCETKYFMQITEVLQDQVMPFVNQIACIVHSIANEYFGSANKNMGESFLLAWNLTVQKPEKRQRLADCALVALVKVAAQLAKAPGLNEFRNHPKLRKKIPFPGIQMGFGLHSGWSIEGAIGSEFKIDASYLSPNILVTESLQEACLQYGCTMLISEAVIRLMSPGMAAECRVIDRIRFPGARDPFGLYTMDLDEIALAVAVREAATSTPGPDQSQRHTQNAGGGGIRYTMTQREAKTKFKLKQERIKRMNERWSDAFDTHWNFITDPDVLNMRSKFNEEFFCRFRMGYLNYIAGQWDIARELLDTARFLLVAEALGEGTLAAGREDGPSASLIRYMSQFPEGAPLDWQGHRVVNPRALN